MPSRVIRAEIISSRSLSRVSLGADLTFRSLLLVVDDYGRTDGRHEVLRAALYPTRPEITSEQVAAWIGELEREGCARRYEVDGDEYLFLPNWEKHRGNQRRAATSRFPEPPASAVETRGTPKQSQEIPGDPGKSPEIPPSGGGGGKEVVVGDERGRGTGGGPAARAVVRDHPGDPLPLTEITQAFAAYDRAVRTWSAARRKTLRARLAEHPGEPEVLAHAVHGYRWLHRQPNDGFDPEAHFTPETIFRPSNFEKYVDAYGSAIASGASPPFRPMLARVGGGARHETREERIHHIDRLVEQRKAEGRL